VGKRMPCMMLCLGVLSIITGCWTQRPSPQRCHRQGSSVLMILLLGASGATWLRPFDRFVGALMTCLPADARGLQPSHDNRPRRLQPQCHKPAPAVWRAERVAGPGRLPSSPAAGGEGPLRELPRGTRARDGRCGRVGSREMWLCFSYTRK
jgi:hypothetical protein